MRAFTLLLATFEGRLSFVVCICRTPQISIMLYSVLVVVTQPEAIKGLTGGAMRWLQHSVLVVGLVVVLVFVPLVVVMHRLA